MPGCAAQEETAANVCTRAAVAKNAHCTAILDFAISAGGSQTRAPFAIAEPSDIGTSLAISDRIGSNEARGTLEKLDTEAFVGSDFDVTSRRRNRRA